MAQKPSRGSFAVVFVVGLVAAAAFWAGGLDFDFDFYAAEVSNEGQATTMQSQKFPQKNRRPT